jgi:hypothetical protein
MSLAAQDFYLVQLLLVIDITAEMLAHGLFGRVGIPRRQPDVMPCERRRLLHLIIRHGLAVSFHQISLARIEMDMRVHVQAMEKLKSGEDIGHIPEPVPPIDDAALSRALDHLTDAVIRRVVQQRDEVHGGKASSWLQDFHEACLRLHPRPITPSLTLRGFEKRLRRLRADVGLPALSDIKVRRSRREIGAARLRAWGL